MTRVAVDTSALMLPVELDIRLFEELERLLGAVTPLVPALVLAELEHLESDGGRPGTAARVGVSLIEERCTVVETEANEADDAVLELARTGQAAYVVTADRELAERVRAAQRPVITPRGRRQLAIQPP